MSNASDWIQRLGLQAHPEGGYFSEVYRAEEQIDGAALPKRYDGARSMSTSIYFLLDQQKFSAFHRINSDEGWHYYIGSSPISLYVISPEGMLTTYRLGPNWEEGDVFQVVIPAQHWFAAHVADVPDAYALVGCTVAPGFDFADFELADRAALSQAFPAHRGLIERLTRGRNV